jgi:N-acetylglutamate synthase-like GNAT family acetyltransferase
MELLNDLPPNNFPELRAAGCVAGVLPPFTVRAATPADAAAIDALIAQSYGTLMQPVYNHDLLIRALPKLLRTRPGLLSGGTYFVADAGGVLLGAGGWSEATPFGRLGPAENGHMRRIAVLPTAVRHGVGSLLAQHALEQAQLRGVKRMFSLSTLAAVRFFDNLGFISSGEVDLTIEPGVQLPAVQMSLDLCARVL